MLGPQGGGVDLLAESGKVRKHTGKSSYWEQVCAPLPVL